MKSRTSLKYPQSRPHCQYHEFWWMRSERALWPQMQRDGWHDTLRFGWVCPACWANKANRLQHLKCREQSDTATPELATQPGLLP